jgi:hypothetical protein
MPRSRNMRQLTILSGAGINLGISAAAPDADQLLGLTYQKVSVAVYERLDDKIKALFTPESFDYILGGLITVNLAIEKTKQDMKRFKVNEQAFMELFRQTDLQKSISEALRQIEEQLTISLDQMLDVVDLFSPAIDVLAKKYDSINYYTLNFDAIFDHILYGRKFARVNRITDFWHPSGDLNRGANRQIKIFHLHGDLRYKPFKKTSKNKPPYEWPVLVVGDNPVKMGVINSNESLGFYKTRFEETCAMRGDYAENDLAIVGFGFRPEDLHITTPLLTGLHHGTFDKVSIYDVVDHLAQHGMGQYGWTEPKEHTIVQFLESLGAEGGGHA